MLLLQFSTSHYCRKARLALAYKKLSYQVENLTPGLHILKLKHLTGGSTTLPVLLPQEKGQPEAIADSTEICQYLETYKPEPSYLPEGEREQHQVKLLEDWLDESIGVATRFVYYDYRAGEGKAIDPSLSSQLVINLVRRQYNINPVAVKKARSRLKTALEILAIWKKQLYLVGNKLTVADLTAAALLSPLALIPDYRQENDWLFMKIKNIHHECGEKLPPGLYT
jgi:glutathione S-transferase